jgi:UDP-N-acetyl-D-galactosamine dehydrogenase
MKKIKFRPVIIGLGYVGLPLLMRVAMKKKVIGFDLNKKRVLELKKNYDNTNEVKSVDIKKYKKNINFTYDKREISSCNLYIITVPTPINKNKKPDLSHVVEATKLVSNFIKKGDTIIYECTVYPGVTEKICGKIISKRNKFKINEDFYLGYSPERVNPGDKKNTIDKITKVVSGSNEYIANLIADFYKSIIPAGIFLSKNIKTAEAAKVIENIQRDLNISLINELSVIFNKLDINIYDVLTASNTKWNFLNFEPGLVGGHCIGVDPYYLTYLSKKIGYNPKLILSGRAQNEKMVDICVNKLIKKSNEKKINKKRSKVLFMGLSFKENCPDLRNSKNLEFLLKLSKKFKNIYAYDPLVDYNKFKSKINKVKFLKYFPKDKFDIIIICIPHNIFLKKTKKKFHNIMSKNCLIFDLKNKFSFLKPDITL